LKIIEVSFCINLPQLTSMNTRVILGMSRISRGTSHREVLLPIAEISLMFQPSGHQTGSVFKVRGQQLHHS